MEIFGTNLSPADIHELKKMLDATTDTAPAGPGFFTPGQPGQFLVIGFIVVAWVVNILLCDRLADDLYINLWVGRLIGLLFPVVGPLVLFIVRIRTRIA